MNSFNSLLIIAFFKGHLTVLGGCYKTNRFTKFVNVNNYCDDELTEQLIFVALINAAKNLVEMGIPMMRMRLNVRQTKAIFGEIPDNSDKVKLFRRNVELNLVDSDEGFVDSVFGEYLEMCIQFGFITLFASAFPLMSVIGWVNNIFEIVVDKRKFLHYQKRPIPKSAADIGNWYTILETITYLAIFCSTGILVFTSNNYSDLKLFWKVILFGGLCFIFLLIKFFIADVIPDMPSEFQELFKRHDYVVDKFRRSRQDCSSNMDKFRIVKFKVL